MKRKSLIYTIGSIGAAALLMGTAYAGGIGIAGYGKDSSGALSAGAGSGSSSRGIAGGIIGGAAEAAGALAGGLFGGAGLSGNISMGYDSEYYYRGVNYGSEPIWAGVEVSVPAGPVGLTLGTWYINPTDSASPLDDELDFYVSTDLSALGLDWSLGYTKYAYPEAGGSTDELGISTGITVADMIDLGIGYYRDLDLDQNYLELTTGGGYDLSDAVSVSLGATLGYLDVDDVSDLSHLLLSASLPVALSENATLEPYVAYNIALDALEGVNDDDEEVFGGVSVSVDF